mmetsp:Transcript_13127/g.30577  ORF Transcript_13127/g.30577 Transcript_13127/m.30577 type:complete len:104 (+) Transcript_13127:691-1002(+)
MEFNKQFRQQQQQQFSIKHKRPVGFHTYCSFAIKGSSTRYGGSVVPVYREVSRTMGIPVLVDVAYSVAIRCKLTFAADVHDVCGFVALEKIIFFLFHIKSFTS